MASAGRLVVAAYAQFWTVDLTVLVHPALCGPSVAGLISRLAAPSVEGCFGWLNRRGLVGA